MIVSIFFKHTFKLKEKRENNMYKLYCRVYQMIMKIGMNALPWRIPETIEGAGIVKKLPKYIESDRFHKVLIVTDKTLMKLHLLDSMIEALENAKIEFILYDEVEPNPTDIKVEKGVVLFNKEKCEAIIAFGGGSAMDCAKAIGARIARPNKTIHQLKGLFKVLKKIPTIYAIPTTAGTGSETTIAAVITNEKTHHKASINDLSLLPRYAVLDPELTLGLPPKVTAMTGMDALCHAVEAYTNNTYNSKLEKELCKKAVKLIFDNLYKVYLNGNDIEARQNMQKAAFYAGRAFTRGSVGYVHAIGHTLSGLYGQPHGLTMAILLPHVMKQYGSAVYDRLAELSDVCGMCNSEETNEIKAKTFIKWIEELKSKMEIPVYPTMIKEEDINQIISWAIKEANPLYPTPVTWNKKEFESFIKSLH